MASNYSIILTTNVGVQNSDQTTNTHNLNMAPTKKPPCKPPAASASPSKKMAANKITRAISSPTKAEQRKKDNAIIVQCYQSLFAGIIVIILSKKKNRLEDGFAYGLYAAVKDGLKFAVDSCLFFMGKIRLDPLVDEAAMNPDSGYLRRSYLYVDSSNTDNYLTSAQRMKMLESICAVSNTTCKSSSDYIVRYAAKGKNGNNLPMILR